MVSKHNPFIIILTIMIGILGLLLIIVPFLKKDNPVRQWFIKVSGATSDEIEGPPEIMIGMLLIIIGWFMFKSDEPIETY